MHIAWNVPYVYTESDFDLLSVLSWTQGAAILEKPCSIIYTMYCHFDTAQWPFIDDQQIISPSAIIYRR